MEKQLMDKINSSFDKNLIGEIIFTNEEYSRIIECAALIIRLFEQKKIPSFGLSSDDAKCLFVALVNVVKTWRNDDSDEKKDDTFWNYAYKMLTGVQISIPTTTYLFITQEISKVCGKNNIKLLNCGKKYYATILAHSLSPQKSLYAFFDLCFDIYFKDLGCTYQKNDLIHQKITEQLNKRFLSQNTSDDDFELCGSVYSLMAGIKKLFAHDMARALELLESTLYNIDKVYEDLYIDVNQNEISNQISAWWNKKKDNLVALVHEKRQRTTIVDKEHITIKYRMISSALSIIIPAIRLEDNFYEKVCCKIYNNDVLLFDKTIDTLGTGLSMSTKYLEIPIVDYLKQSDVLNIRVELEHADKLLYDSKKQLFRDFLLFSGEKEICGCEVDVGSYALFTTDVDNFISSPISLQDLNGYAYSIYAENDETIHYKNKKVFFTSEKSGSRAWVNGNILNDILYIQDELEYRVFSSIDNISIVDRKNNLKSFVLKVNDHPISRDADSDIEEQIIKLSFDSFVPYKIDIYNINTEKLFFTKNIILIPNCNVSYDKKYYYGNNCDGIFTFQYGENTKNIVFNSNYNNEIVFTLNEGEFVSAIPKVSYELLGEERYKALIEPLFIDKINNGTLLKINKPNDLSLSLKVDNNLINEIKPNVFELGKAIYSQINEERLTVFFQIDDSIEEIMQITTIPLLIKEPQIFINKNVLEWNAVGCYIGDNECSFKIEIYNRKKRLICTAYLTKLSNKAIVECDSLTNGIYTIKIFALPKGYVKKEYLLTTYQHVVGDYDEIRFFNKTLEVSNVMCFGKTEKQAIITFYIDELTYLGEKEFKYYEGKLFIKKNCSQKTYLNYMYNGKDNDEINPVRIELRTDNSFWLVAGLGENIDDFLGELGLDRRTSQLSNLQDIRKIIGIDYYFFSEKEDDYV